MLLSRLKSALPAVLLCLSLGAQAGPPGDQAPPVSEPARWAMGLRVGAPTGFTIKRYLGGRNAWDFNIDAIYGPGLRVGADYLFGIAQLMTDRSTLDLDIYIGLGPFVGTLRGPCGGFDNWRQICNGDIYVGGRVPIGLEAVFRTVPFTLGLEVAPGLAFAPGRVGFLLDANLIFRVLFN